jgi:hypothetical protein
MLYLKKNKYCTKFLNQYSFICSKFYKLNKYNINISHNKTTGLNGIIRDNKCIFTKLNAVFILKTAAWAKKILQRLIPSQIPLKNQWKYV